jgi:GAF domain-containing protein
MARFPAAPIPQIAPTTKLLAQLEERTEQLAIVNGILRTIVSGAPLPDILRVFASNLKTIVPFDRCSIAVYDEKRRVFHVPYMVMGGKVQETHEGARPFESSPLSKVIETRRPVMRRNIRKERKGFDSDGRFLKQGFGCEILFPLQVGERPFGTLNMAAFEPERLTDAHLRIVDELIPAVAVAVWHHLGSQKLIFL